MISGLHVIFINKPLACFYHSSEVERFFYDKDKYYVQTGRIWVQNMHAELYYVRPFLIDRPMLGTFWRGSGSVSLPLTNGYGSAPDPTQDPTSFLMTLRMQK